MAIYPRVSSYEQSPGASPPVNVEARTEQVAESLGAVSISAPQTLRGTTASLVIPLDERRARKSTDAVESEGNTTEPLSESRPRREPLRRDSLKRRDALLKGKEGSRQRRRWENGW